MPQRGHGLLGLVHPDPLQQDLVLPGGLKASRGSVVIQCDPTAARCHGTQWIQKGLEIFRKKRRLSGDVKHRGLEIIWDIPRPLATSSRGRSNSVHVSWPACPMLAGVRRRMLRHPAGTTGPLLLVFRDFVSFGNLFQSQMLSYNTGAEV